MAGAEAFKQLTEMEISEVEVVMEEPRISIIQAHGEEEIVVWSAVVVEGFTTLSSSKASKAEVATALESIFNSIQELKILI